MVNEDKVKRYVVNPDKTASSKARRFYKLLAGADAPRRITNRELQKIINAFTDTQVAAARETLRLNKRATKYQLALCKEMGLNTDLGCSRKVCEYYITSVKKDKPDDFREAKEKLRGFTYKEEV